MKLRRVNAISAHEKAPIGVSGAWFLHCDDGFTYIVKFLDDTKAVLNEFVGGNLCKSLTLPTPDIVLVRIERNLLDHLGLESIAEGDHIGFKKLQNSFDFNSPLTKLHLSNIINGNSISGVLCFDNWVLNRDRANNGNNMINLENGVPVYYMIDFGHCFLSNSWTPPELDANRKTEEFCYIQEQLNPFINLDDTNLWLARIQKFSIEEINCIVNSVPEYWSQFSSEDRRSLKSLLIDRKDLVGKVIYNFLNG
jgi:hypothetical protein